jgi:uncharacterized membrane protein SpoIIM required for sporulation/uncharacterized RDD family membrane protein YckC
MRAHLEGHDGAMRYQAERMTPGVQSASQTRLTRGYDQVIAIETPEQVVFSYTVAGIGSRAAAALIDHTFIATAILSLLLVYAFFLAPMLGAPAGMASLFARHSAAWALAVILLLQFVIQWGYYVLYEALWDGQTPGKRWLGLRVVQDGGYSVSFAASAARNIARVLDMQPAFVYLVGIVAVAVSKTGKRTGDHLAGTFVVRERVLSRPRVPDSPGPSTASPVHRITASLREDELEILERFLSRTDALTPERRDVLAGQLARTFAAHLPDADIPVLALRTLYDDERAARARGVSGRDETGASREQYAILAEGEARWSHFATRLADAQRRGLRVMSADEVASFVSDYREIATDLARLSTATRGRELDSVFRLSRLVAGGHNLLYRQKRLATRTIARFLLVTVPAEVRRSAAPIIAAAVLLFGSGAAAYVAVVGEPATAELLVPAGMIDRAETDAARARAGDASYIDVDAYARPLLTSSVMRNNVQVTFLAFASGLTAGILTVVLLVLNGISIGAAIGLFASKGVGHLIVDFITAHGPFELTAICIAAGGGFLIATAMLLPGPRTRREALVLQGRRALRLLAAAALFLVFAGLIEGLISPRTDLGYAFKLTVALVSVLAIAAYLSLGRSEPIETEEDLAYNDDLALMAR